MELRWILFLPLIGALLNGLLLRSKASRFSGWIATTFMLVAFALSLSVFFQLDPQSAWVDTLYSWINLGTFQINFELEVTPLTAVMLLVITGIGTLIHIYAACYMAHDESPWRFFAYLNLFVAAMLFLVLSSNLLGVFLGWEGVGLCSYLLIGYWYKEKANTAAGMKAFLVNRIGDLGFFAALLLAVAYFKTTDISSIIELFQGTDALKESIPGWVWVAFLAGIFWAATGKSAQIPLYVWLPDAMAGPTPVSALIHAATMVTSGIFVLSRLWPVLSAFEALQQVIFCIGMATAWLAALTALTQRDLKKILAYSTVSQLGFMFVALGAGSPVAAFFHVVTHACFKALLFLTAGSIIHGVHDKKDIFSMGGLRKLMPFSHIAYLVGCLAIAGFPLTSGFFSKDMILAHVYNTYGTGAYVLLLGAAALTAFYMFRSYTLVFWGTPRSQEAKEAHESSVWMWAPLMVLAFLSLVVGFFELPPVMGKLHKFSDWMEASWYGVFPLEHLHLSHFTEWMLMFVATLVSLASAYGAYVYYRNFKEKDLGSFAFAHKISWNKFYVDEFYQLFFVMPFKRIGQYLNILSDEKIINRSFHALFAFYKEGGGVLSLFHSGNLQSYAWYTLSALLLSFILAMLFFV